MSRGSVISAEGDKNKNVINRHIECKMNILTQNIEETFPKNT